MSLARADFSSRRSAACTELYGHRGSGSKQQKVERVASALGSSGL